MTSHNFGHPVDVTLFSAEAQTFIAKSLCPSLICLFRLKWTTPNQNDALCLIWNNEEWDTVHLIDLLFIINFLSGFVGTCWGTYMTVRLSSYVEVKAGISMHPSHTPVIGMLSENEEEILKEIKSPQVSFSVRAFYYTSSFELLVTIMPVCFITLI